MEIAAKTEENILTKESMEILDKIISRYKGKRGALMPVLQEAQEEFGYLPIEIQNYIATQMGIPASEVYGVVTFYHFFTMVPKGRHTIKVCLGTACYVRGGKKIIEKLKNDLGIDIGGTTPDRRFSLDVVRCLGACGLAPVVMVDNDIHQGMKPSKLDKTLEPYK
ncbi:MAG: NADH-quinone oxidoreductase subunit NuoE [Deltaproteobacteria bacterium]|nr:NADH-quinone oxidoreductase subunit NuoE [Deltaproteobacteria bacterium]